jgi:hypothetical protein
MTLAEWLVPCLSFPGLPHIYFLFTAWLRIFHVCRNENFRNRYLSFYWKKWFDIWYMALAWWLVPCLPFPGLPCDLEFFMFAVIKTRAQCFRLVYDPFSGNECWDIYKFDTNERVGVFLARRSVQHLVLLSASVLNKTMCDLCVIMVTMADWWWSLPTIKSLYMSISVIVFCSYYDGLRTMDYCANHEHHTS